MNDKRISKFVNTELYHPASGKSLEISKFYLKSIRWRLAEFYYNRGLQRPYTGTCTILQETINGFLCPITVFLK